MMAPEFSNKNFLLLCTLREPFTYYQINVHNFWSHSTTLHYLKNINTPLRPERIKTLR